MTATAADQNRAYYDRLSSGTQDYWRKMAAPRFRVETLVRELRRLAPRSIVDLGCGNGALLSDLRDALPSAALIGIDVSSAQVMANRGSMPWARFEVADLSLPIEGLGLGTFDAVVSSELIEHLDDPDRMLSNAAALLGRGGHLLLTTQSGPVRETERRVGHVRHFTAPELEAMVLRAEMTPVRIWNAGYPFHDLSKWYANLDPDRSMRQFGDKPYGLKEDLICAALRLAFKLNSRQHGAQLFAIARR